MPTNPSAKTHFVNWQRYFNANKDEAQEQADAFSAQAKAKVDAAKAAQAKVTGEFAQKSGQPAAPAASTNVGAAAAPPQGAPRAMSQQQPTPGLQAIGASSPPAAPAPPPGAVAGYRNDVIGPDGTLVSSSLTGNTPAAPGATPEQLDQQSKDALYQGPLGLAGLEGYDNAVSSTLGAENYLNALGTDDSRQALFKGPGLSHGQSAFDAALTGQAGGKDFSRLRGYFQPGKELSGAEKAAEDYATRATAEGKGLSERLKTQAATERKRLEDVDTDTKDAATIQKANDAADAGAKTQQSAEKTRAATSYEDFNRGLASQAAIPSLYQAQISPKTYKAMSTAEWSRVNQLARDRNWNELTPLLRQLQAKYDAQQ